MTTYVVPLKSGVAHFAPLTLLSIFCLLSLIPFGLTMPYQSYSPMDAGSALKGETFPWEEKPKESYKGAVFIATNVNMLLQITDDGTIEGTKCRSSRNAMLMTRAHHIAKLKNKKVITIKGMETNRHLCMNESGHLYSSEPGEFNEMECSFSFNEQWIQSNDSSFNKTVFRLSRLRHHKKRFYVGLNCDGKPMVAKDCRQRRKYRKYLLFNMGDFNAGENSAKCKDLDPPKCKRTYLKFCRKVVRNFFSVSVRDWKKFRARKCFKRLGREKKRMKKIDEKCAGKKRSRRHVIRRLRRHPT